MLDREETAKRIAELDERAEQYERARRGVQQEAAALRRLHKIPEPIRDKRVVDTGTQKRLV